MEKITNNSDSSDKSKGRIKRMVLSAGLLLNSTVLVRSSEPEITEYEILQAESERHDGQELVVMSANVHKWQDRNGQSNFASLMSAIVENDVDIACLQEVDIKEHTLSEIYNYKNHQNSEGYNVLFAQAEQPLFGDQYGNAVISPYQIEIHQVEKLPDEDQQPRNAILFNLPTDEGDIKLANAHLSPYRPSQFAQIRSLLQISQRDSLDFICADWNQTEAEVDRAGFGKSFNFNRQSGPSTYPSSNPKRAIDFVVDNCPSSDSNTSKTIDFGSDHLAIIQTINLQDC